MKKRILVALLNWGIGHACRCIPIIRTLQKANFEVVIASDNEALALLRKEFPKLPYVELPSYNITYALQRSQFKRHLFKQLPQIYKSIKLEHKATQQIIKDFAIDGIISDNRLGVYSKSVPSVFITHQLKVYSGITTYFSTKLHHYYINKFNFCWVPDFKETPNLSGNLSHSSTLKIKIPLRYIGPLSRFTKQNTKSNYDILILLSGPEPQRTLLEKKLFKAFINTNYNVAFVKGIIEASQTIETHSNIKSFNFLTSDALENIINSSDLVICRSGYTSVMDLAKLNKKAFFIPTPGQFEQEYLAEYLKTQHIANFCNQEDFNLSCLKKNVNYIGFISAYWNNEIDAKLFDCFV